MKSITHPELVTALCKSGDTIAAELNNKPEEKALLLSAVQYVLQEGEILEAIKKRTIYNKPEAWPGDAPNTPHPELTPNQAHLLHMSIGIAGEALELLDAVYKHINYKKPLDWVNVVEESGDIEFYHEGFRQGVNLDRDEALNQNIAKLSKRYASLSYSDSAARDRADKVEA